MTDTSLLIACLLAVGVAAVALAVLVRSAKWLGLVDRPGGRKLHTGEVALVGGLSAMVGLLVAALWFDGLGPFHRMLLATATALVVIEAIDDRGNLGVRFRVLAQTIVILTMIFVTGVYVHQLGGMFGVEVRLGWFGIPFTCVAVIGLLNAFNLVDGIDGLAIGLTWIAAVGILLASGITPGHGVGALLVLLSFALLPAFAANLGMFGQRGRCFLGDAGSTLIGYLIGWALIFCSQQPGTHLSPVGTLWCVALPVLDTLAVMVRRARLHKNPFKPDRGHIHHLLMNAGFGPRATLGILLVVAAGMWAFGALVNALQLGAGSNLIAFCVLIAVYTIATGRVYKRQLPRIASRAGQAERIPPSAEAVEPRSS